MLSFMPKSLARAPAVDLAKTKTIVMLFPNERDRLELALPHYQSRYKVHFEGFDLHHFPDNAKLVTFNIRRYIDALTRRCEKLQPDAVISTDEHFGALIAAIVAQRLGLPGTNPQAILNAQHKLYARQIEQRVVPHATPAFSHFSYEISQPSQAGLPFPFFVKPIKATWSVLARRVDNFAELKQHLSFHPLEKFIIKRLVRPFNQLLESHDRAQVNAHHLIAEELLEGQLVTLEGYARDGEIHILGITDSIMFPGTYAFKRFEYPSRLAESVQARMADIAKQVMRAMTFDLGLFNMELYYHEETDAIKIVEINPRLARQFVDIHEKVNGINTLEILLALSLGEDIPQPVTPEYGCAASFIFRDFSGQGLYGGPNESEMAWLKNNYPDARLLVYPKHGASLAREIKWLGSYRYAVLNLGGKDRADLQRLYEDVAAHLSFDLRPSK